MILPELKTVPTENLVWPIAAPDKLADSVGVPRASITAIEDGSYEPSLFLAYDIAEALTARVTELFRQCQEECDSKS